MKKIRFYCTWCGIPYEYDKEQCTTFTLKKRSFLRQVENTFAAGPCPKCGFENIEQIKENKNDTKR